MLLQAEAVRRIRGQASIHEAARNGHEELVALHIAADDQCVNLMAKRGTSEFSVYATCRPSDASPSPNLSHPPVCILPQYFHEFILCLSLALPYFFRHACLQHIITPV